MTNDTPENSHSNPDDLTGGQHEFGATLSSEPAASIAGFVPDPVVPPAADPVAPPASEPVVPPSAEPVVPPSAEPVVPPSAEPVEPVGTHDFAMGQQAPAGAQAPAGTQLPNAYPAGYQADGYPASAYSVPPSAPKSSMSKGLLFGLIGGGVALVLIVAAVIVVPMLLRGPAQTASGVVEEYLTAVSEGDAETALTYVEPSADESLLTDEALAASLELAPITDIVVEESEDAGEYGSADVSASFAIGGETVEREFEVYKYSDDWQIYDGLVMATIGNFEGLGLTVNGNEPGDTSVSLFPGTYQLALAYEEFAIDADTDTFTVTADEDAEAFWELQPILTDDGVASFRSLVRAAVEECVAMKSLTTPCGMDITDIDLQGYTAVDDSVTRTITAEGQKHLDAMEPTADYSTPTLVSTYDSVDVDMTLQGTKDGATSEFDVWFGGYMSTPSVDFSAETPTVIWD